MKNYDSCVTENDNEEDLRHKLETTLKKYDSVVNHADILVFECSLIKKTVTITSNLSNNLLFAADFCISLDEFINSDIIDEKDKNIVLSVPEKLRVIKATFASINVKNDNGEYVRFEAYFYGVYNDDGELTDIVGSAKDCEKKTVPPCEDKENDKLTGLLGNDCFYHNIDDILRNELDKRFSLIMIGVSGFNYISQLYGADFSDKVLRYIAFKLKKLEIFKDALITYFANDSFALFVDTDIDLEILGFIEKIKQGISMYRHIPLKYTFGIYKSERKAVSARVICDCANIAKESVKGHHLNNVAFYSDGMRERIIEDINIENEMEKALSSGQFEMFLQPKYDISESRIVGAEALVRWNHPYKGFITPDTFIPLFERNGFVIKLDTYIWEQACKTIKRWHDMGYEPIPLSVNVSRVNVSNPYTMQTLNDLVEKYGIEKKNLELEITETVYYDDQISLIKVLSELKSEGYTLLMDDFGSGFSSLNMLKNTPFDVLKIDRKFLNETMMTEKGKKIIRHTISLSNDIGLDIVAEGVETKQQADFLLESGCHTAQGYYYSKPVDISSFEKLIGYC